jgi:hypothetical protein
VLVSFVDVVACRLFALVVLLARNDRSKELELLVLRHELLRRLRRRESASGVRGSGLAVIGLKGRRVCVIALRRPGGLGDAMSGLSAAALRPEELLETRGLVAREFRQRASFRQLEDSSQASSMAQAAAPPA